MFDAIGDFFSDFIDTIKNFLVDGLLTLFGWIMYYISIFVCGFVKLTYRIFEVFSGSSKVTYNGESDFLINILFNNDKISDIYWGIALVSIALTFAFAGIAVIKKTFDLGDKERRSMGAILLGIFKSILTILLTTVCLTTAINLVNLLTITLDDIFNNAGNMWSKDVITYTDEEYAAMARVFNSVGNYYSLNDAGSNRFNVNACYNEIRGDLYFLQKSGKFDVDYMFYKSEENSDGSKKIDNSWQSMIQMLLLVEDPRYDLPIDGVNVKLSNALEYIDNVLRTDASFEAHSSFKREFSNSSQAVPLDVVVFLMGTGNSALNDFYNKSPDLHDAVRGPFYTGDMDIYSLGEVSASFDIKIGGIDYLTIILLAYFTVKNLFFCVFGCITRMINLLGLYIVAPPFAATIPSDDGERFKQWLSAVVVQMFGIFGHIIPLRLTIMLIPMIVSSDLVLIPDNVLLNLLAKGVFIIGAMEATSRFSELLNGILAGSGGYSSAHASNVDNVSNQMFGAAKGAVGAGFGAAATYTGLKTVGNSVAGKARGIVGGMEKYGGIGGMVVRGLQGKEYTYDPKSAGGGGGGGGEEPSSYQSMKLPDNNSGLNERQRNPDEIMGKH